MADSFFLLLVEVHRRHPRADFTELSRNARFADFFQSIRNRQGSLSFVRTIHEDRKSHAALRHCDAHSLQQFRTQYFQRHAVPSRFIALPIDLCRGIGHTIKHLRRNPRIVVFLRRPGEENARGKVLARHLLNMRAVEKDGGRINHYDFLSLKPGVIGRVRQNVRQRIQGRLFMSEVDPHVRIFIETQKGKRFRIGV